MIHYKINFFLNVGTLPSVIHNSYINRITMRNQGIVHNIFHYMTGVKLSESYPRIAKAYISKIVLIWVIKIVLTFYIIAFRHVYQESIFTVPNITADSI